MSTRVIIVVLIALLALPVAESAAPVEAKRRTRTVTRTFANTAGIAIPTDPDSPVSAALYPSSIKVSRLKGTIRDVNLSLDGFVHTSPYDVQVLLVGPGGQTAVVMAEVGDETAGNLPVTLRLDDEAAARIPDSVVVSGTFQPTNDDGVIAFNTPAPPADANAALSVFDGTNPNGEWRLFVQDEYGQGYAGAITTGWTLEITANVKVKKKKRR
jgi:hypothetical protein